MRQWNLPYCKANTTRTSLPANARRSTSAAQSTSSSRHIAHLAAISYAILIHIRVDNTVLRMINSNTKTPISYIYTLLETSILNFIWSFLSHRLSSSQEHNSHKLQNHPTVVQLASQLKHSSGAPVTPTQVLLRYATNLSSGGQIFLIKEVFFFRRAHLLTILNNVNTRTGTYDVWHVHRFSVQDGIAAIPKASSEQHLADNLQVFDFSLDATQHAALGALSQEPGGGRYFDWDPTSVF